MMTYNDNDPIPISELKAESTAGNNGTDSLHEMNYRSSNVISADKLETVKVGGSLGQFWGNEYSMTYGVDIKNPSNKHACNITIEVSFKDNAGHILKVNNDTIFCINPGEVFHYGGQVSGMYTRPESIHAIAYAQEFLDLSDLEMDIASFGNFAYKCDGAFGRLTGELHAKFPFSLQRVYIYFQYLNAIGEIIGGGNELVDYLPGSGMRAIEHSGFVPDNPSKIEWTADISLTDFLESASGFFG